MWLLAMTLFYIPLVLVVAELTARFDDEGGVYLWTREAMGPFSAFVCGWCYWTANVTYLPSLLVFTVGVIAVLLGHSVADVPPSTVFLAAAAMMIGVLVLNILGLAWSKWLTNIGGVALWATLLMVLVAGGMTVFLGQSVTSISDAQFLPTVNSSTIILWAVVTFGLSGTEGISFIRTDVRGGQRALVRALLIAGLCIVLAYVAGTIAVMTMLRPDEIGSLSGISDALLAGFEKVGWSAIAPVALVLLAVSTIGGLNAWFGAAARLPFAAGIDNVLPSAFGRRHPRYHSPYIALLVQAGLVIVFLALSQAGSSSEGSYAFLVRMSILGYSLPYLFIFWSYLKIRSPSPDAGLWQVPGGKLGRRVVGWTGLFATISAIAATLMPDPTEGDPFGAFLKVIVSGGVLVLAGVFLYLFAKRRQHRSLVSAAERALD